MIRCFTILVFSVTTHEIKFPNYLKDSRGDFLFMTDRQQLSSSSDSPVERRRIECSRRIASARWITRSI